MNIFEAITLCVGNPYTKITHDELFDTDYIYYTGGDWRSDCGHCFDISLLDEDHIQDWEIYKKPKTKKMVTYYMPLVYYRKNHGVFPYDGGEYQETQELEAFFGVSWDKEVIEWSVVEAPEVM